MGGSDRLPEGRVITDGVSHLDPVVASKVASQIVEVAERLTTGQLAARMRRLCLETDPDDARRRYENRVEERRVAAQPHPDGTAHLMGLSLPADRAAAVMDRLTHLAKGRRRRSDPRTIDQLRADIFLELLEQPLSEENLRRAVVDMPATDCDIDHTIAYLHRGHTLVDDMGPACRHDHTLKTRGHWTITSPHPGIYHWTSSHGHAYPGGIDPP